MHRDTSVGFLVLLALVACAPVKPSPSPTTPGPTPGGGARAPTMVKGPAPPPGNAPAPSTAATPAAQPTSPGPATRAQPAQTSVATTEQPGKPAAAPPPGKAAVAGTGKSKTPRTDSTEPTLTADARAAPPPNAAGAAGTTAKQPPSLALDLAQLEQRLRDTHAIGVFTKLSLKNQVDDLLNQFRAFHSGQLKATLADLRQRYDLLLLKVLTVLQDGDPQLASAISASRDTIWGILTDRQKFQKI